MDVREKLVELLREAPYNIFGNKLGNCYFDSCLELIADHLITNGVTVQEWISVKDRLPEESGLYIPTRNSAGARYSSSRRKEKNNASDDIKR